MSKKWVEKDGKWYYTDNGNNLIGWQSIDGHWYFMNSDGVMQTGWLKDNGKWYYLNDNGTMAQGWVSYGNKWYHMNLKGEMETGWQSIDDHWYFLNEKGDMATGWVFDNNKWYYLEQDGVMLNNCWKQDGDKWYYLNKDGTMATSTQFIDNKIYYFQDNGQLTENLSDHIKYDSFYGKEIETTDAPEVMTSDVKDLLESNGIYSRFEMNWIEKFNRFAGVDIYNFLGPTREYIFFTKPDLNIFSSNRVLNKQIAKDPFFIEMNDRYYDILRSLQKSYSDTTPGPFLNILFHAIKSNVDLPSISINETETASNIYGTAISYMGSSERSDENHEFSVELEDSKYLEVYHLLKAWSVYETKKQLGLVSPPSTSYIEKKELHDQVSMYKIVVGEDGESIIYYAKFVGVYPKGVPRDTFGSLDKDGGITYSVPFHAEFVDDLNPMIIDDFNNDVSFYKSQFGSDIPYYNDKISAINGKWCNIPYIAPYKTGSNLLTNTMEQYKLRWR